MQRHLNKSVTRRDVLRYCLAGAGITALGPMSGVLPVASGAPIPNHKRLVIVFCDGGYDGLNVLVPVNSGAYYARRPNLAIPGDQTIDIGQTGYELNPALVQIGALFNEGHGAAIRGVGYPDENLSHFVSTDVHSYGYRDFTAPAQRTGWMARFADLYAQTPLGAASVGVGRHPILAGGDGTNTFQGEDLSSFAFDADTMTDLAHLHRMVAVQDMLGSFRGTGLSSEAFDAINQGHQVAEQIQQAVTDYNSGVGNQYPAEAPGPYLKDIARLIQVGMETRVFFTSFPGFDTHGNQNTRLPALLTTLDQAVGTFVADLREMNVFDDTLILIVTEFGRRIFENAAFGTDHGHGNTFFALGDGVNGGLYGADLDESEMQSENWLGYQIDYRDVLRAAIANHLGADPAPLFPEPQEFNTALSYV